MTPPLPPYQEEVTQPEAAPASSAKVAADATLSSAPAQEAAVDEIPKSTYATSVYLENSGSMDGYVRGNTQFEDAIYRMLVDLNYWADTLSLNYINSQPIPYRQDVSQFISDLEPQEFQQRGGNRGDRRAVLRQSFPGHAGILLGRQ